MKWILIFAFLLFSHFTIFGQSKIEENCRERKVRLVQSKPSVYLTFEKIITDKPLFQGESNKRILLRFNNNTIWNVYIGTFAVEKEYGDFGVPYEVNVLPNAIVSDTKNSIVPSGYKISSSVKTISPGQSFLFSIPEEHLPDNLFITISFTYEWEEGYFAGGGGIEIMHKISFLPSQLPKSKQ